MLQKLPSFYTKFSEKSPFITANTYKKYIVCEDYCIAHHNDKTCFLPACKYHIILFGKFEELLKKLDIFCFTYQHVDCLYTLFKHRFSRKVNAKSGQMFDPCNEQLTLITETRKWRNCRALQRRGSCGNISKSIFSAPFERQKQRTPVDQCLQKKLNKLRRLNSS